MKKMKLKIIKYFWAVGRRTKRVGANRIPVSEGASLNINGVLFKIEKIEEDAVAVSVIRRDGKTIKEMTVEKGKRAYYRPMSMDGGYEYILKLTRFF